jgi:hypothetical protein
LRLGAVLSKFNFLLTALALIKPNIVKWRRCINNSTIVGSLDVGIPYTSQEVLKISRRHWPGNG